VKRIPGRAAASALAALALCAAPLAAAAADAEAGRSAFRQQCALCHSAEAGDGGGAQGPSLQGVFGRAAGRAPGFSFTPALRESGLTWDAATLDRYLAAPAQLVPGSGMLSEVPNAAERENLVAYLQGLQADSAAPAPAAGGEAAGGAEDWRADRPGRRHRISAEQLPAPFATEAARNFPQVVPRPSGAQLAVPAGFQVNLFAENLEGPRVMRLAPGGDIFLAETRAGRIKVLRPAADGRTAASAQVFAEGLQGPFGLQFYPAGADPQWLYVAERNRVVRFAYRAGAQVASGAPEVVVPELSPTSNGHTTRDLAFSLDGKRMFVSVGSLSNVAERMPAKTPEQIQAWEASHAVGAAWGDEEKRAAVLVFELGSDQPAKLFATGIRNCVGLTVQPATGEPWCTTNERDRIGDDLVPDYTTRVAEGGFYGWPWYYIGAHEEPRHAGARPDLAGKVLTPDVLIASHSAPLNLTFYTASSGAAAFPEAYVGDGFAVLHGSWNRAERTGHKVVRVLMDGDRPTGEYEDFLTGFIVDNGNVWGRPVAAVVAADGALLVSEDGNNTIQRIAYSR
jgi:glucose/arabinose dehydrogenase